MRLRPETLEEMVGQSHIVGKDKLLYRAIKADKLSSVIFMDRREQENYTCKNYSQYNECRVLSG